MKSSSVVIAASTPRCASSSRSWAASVSNSTTSSRAALALSASVKARAPLSPK